MKSFSRLAKHGNSSLSLNQCRFFSQGHKRTTIPSERYWDPNKIYPTEPGHVRVTGITLRDGHQSLNGGMHRIDLLTKAAPLIDKLRPATMEYPGSEEIGGGTTVDFPLRFRGENPFRNMERISSLMPNTPTSALIRSDSLCGYSINPRDVVRTFAKYYARAGIDIFRVFDAYNNVANHETFANAVLDNNKHYQAAITFTSHEDPTLFNVKWVRDIAKDFVSMGAHSICIKDMAGIASPALMKAWVTEIKDALPHIPVIIHSHYTTGFSPITYIQAIEAGASTVDCGISTLSGRSGHPAMEVFNQVLYDLGYNLGWDHKATIATMKPIADLYREYHPRYEFCEMKMAGSVDYRVFTQGIPGGQISIMKNELVRNGYGHLFDNVIEQIQRVRTQVGGVALVTPTSEHVARQSIVNAMNNHDRTTMDSPFWPGYSEMLRGTMGIPPAKMDTQLQKRALVEWAEGIIKGFKFEDDNLTKELQSKVPQMVDYLWEKSLASQAANDSKYLQARIRQLKELDAQTYASQIAESETELTEVSKYIDDNAVSDYLSILRKEPSDTLYSELLNETGLGSFVSSSQISKEDALEIIKQASFCTVCPSSILPDGMEQARLEVEQLAVEHDFEIPARGSDAFEEFAVLQCMFRHAQNIALNWFKNHSTNPHFWDKNFPSDFPFDREEDDSAKGDILPVMYPYRSHIGNDLKHKQLAVEWSDTELKRVLLSDLKRLRAAKNKLQQLQSETPFNEYREILKDRAVNTTKSKISALESKIRGKLKTSMFNVRSHDAGYDIDISSSVEQNYQRAIALAV